MFILNRLRIFKKRLHDFIIRLRKFGIVRLLDSSSSFWKSCTTFERRNYLSEKIVVMVVSGRITHCSSVTSYDNQLVFSLSMVVRNTFL